MSMLYLDSMRKIEMNKNPKSNVLIIHCFFYANLNVLAGVL